MKDVGVCNLLVKIDNQEEVKATSNEQWPTRNGQFVSSLTIDQRLDCPDEAEVTFMGSKDGERTLIDYVKEGAKVELGMGYEQPEALFKGEITQWEVDDDCQSGTYVTIRCWDKSHRLTRGFSAKTWGDGATEDQMISDIVSDIISGSKAQKGDKSDGLSTASVDSTEYKVRYVPRAMTTAADFIKDQGSNLARASDAEDEAQVSFRKLDINKSPCTTVNREKIEGDNPIRAKRVRFNISTYPNYAKVRVHGWNTKDKIAFVGEAEGCSSEIDCASANGWTAGWEAASKALYGGGGSGAIYERVIEFCETKEEAVKVAQGIFDRFSLRYLTGEAEVQGEPTIKPGEVVEFKGFGPRFDGKVLVTQATHHISAKGSEPYTTTFNFCANAAGDAQ